MDEIHEVGVHEVEHARPQFVYSEAQGTDQEHAHERDLEGLDELVVSGFHRHLEVIDFMRKEFEEKGAAPSIRRLNKLNVVPTKELYSLFPGGPAKKAAKIAGLGKPQGCI